MELSSIGRRIREERLSKSWKQEDLAERTDLSVAYIGMIERGEKIPKLATFIHIVDALGVSADEILSEELDVGYKIRISKYQEKIEKLSKEEQHKLFRVLEVMLKKE